MYEKKESHNKYNRNSTVDNLTVDNLTVDNIPEVKSVKRAKSVKSVITPYWTESNVEDGNVNNVEDGNVNSLEDGNVNNVKDGNILVKNENESNVKNNINRENINKINIFQTSSNNENSKQNSIEKKIKKGKKIKKIEKIKITNPFEFNKIQNHSINLKGEYPFNVEYPFNEGFERSLIEQKFIYSSKIMSNKLSPEKKFIDNNNNNNDNDNPLIDISDIIKSSKVGLSYCKELNSPSVNSHSVNFPSVNSSLISIKGNKYQESHELLFNVKELDSLNNKKYSLNENCFNTTYSLNGDKRNKRIGNNSVVEIIKCNGGSNNIPNGGNCISNGNNNTPNGDSKNTPNGSHGNISNDNILKKTIDINEEIIIDLKSKIKEKNKLINALKVNLINSKEEIKQIRIKRFEGFEERNILNGGFLISKDKIHSSINNPSIHSSINNPSIHSSINNPSIHSSINSAINIVDILLKKENLKNKDGKKQLIEMGLLLDQERNNNIRLTNIIGFLKEEIKRIQDY